jgi:hypothetical protein
MFQWLSDIAANYTQYKFTTIQFEYVPRCSVNSNGSVLLSFSADPSLASPADYNEQMNLPTESGNVFSAVTLPIPKKTLDRLNAYLVDTDGTAEDDFDVLRLYVGIVDFVGTAGDLWVSYHVQLLAPRENALTQFTSYAATTNNAKATTKVYPAGFEEGPFSEFNTEMAGSIANPRVEVLAHMGTPTSGYALNRAGYYLITYNWTCIATDTATTDFAGYFSVVGDLILEASLVIQQLDSYNGTVLMLDHYTLSGYALILVSNNALTNRVFPRFFPTVAITPTTQSLQINVNRVWDAAVPTNIIALALKTAQLDKKSQFTKDFKPNSLISIKYKFTSVFEARADKLARMALDHNLKPRIRLKLSLPPLLHSCKEEEKEDVRSSLNNVITIKSPNYHSSK